MKPLTLITITAFISISAIASLKKEWFGFLHAYDYGDKIAHFIGSGLLVALLLPSLKQVDKPMGWLPILLASALVTAEELLQLFIPTRVFSFVDLSWSLSGILIVSLVMLTMRPRKSL